MWEILCILWWFGHDYEWEPITPWTSEGECFHCGRISYRQFRPYLPDDPEVAPREGNTC